VPDIEHRYLVKLIVVAIVMLMVFIAVLPLIFNTITSIILQSNPPSRTNTSERVKYTPYINDLYNKHNYLSSLLNWTTSINTMEPASFIVFTDGSKYYVKNGFTGLIEYSDTDASNVIQYAIDSLVGKWGTVVLAPGIYRLSKTITLYPGIGLRGFYAGWSNGTDGFGTILTGNFNAPIIKVVKHSSYKDNFLYTVFPYITELMITSTAPSGSTNNHGIYISSENGVIHDMYLRNVMVAWCKGHGIYISGGGKYYIIDSYSEGNALDGIYINNAWLVHIINNYIYGNRNGIYISPTNGFAQVMIIGNTINGNNWHGIFVYPSLTNGHVIIVGNTINRSGSGSGFRNIYLVKVANFIIANNVLSDDRSPVVTEYHIVIQDASSGGVIEGNIFRTPAATDYLRIDVGAKVYVLNNLGLPANIGKVSVSVPVGTNNLYGSGAIAYPFGNYFHLFNDFDAVITIGGSLASGETITVKITLYFSDGSSSYIIKTYTATGTYELGIADKVSLLQNGKDIQYIMFNAMSNQASTNATVTATVYATS